MKKRSLFLALVLMLVLAVSASALADTYYVKTDNGKTLNIRYDDTLASGVMARLAYGAKIDVLTFTKNGTWALFTYKGKTLDGEDFWGDAYVMARYLSKTNPGKYKGKGSSSQTSTTVTDTKSSTTVEQMNKLLAKPTFVAPYPITVHATRASGWVYLRWLPSRQSEMIATYPDGKTLNVLAQLTDWYQVQDPDTGRVGFIYKSYVN